MKKVFYLIALVSVFLFFACKSEAVACNSGTGSGIDISSVIVGIWKEYKENPDGSELYLVFESDNTGKEYYFDLDTMKSEKNISWYIRHNQVGSHFCIVHSDSDGPFLCILIEPNLNSNFLTQTKLNWSSSTFDRVENLPNK